MLFFVFRRLNKYLIIFLVVLFVFSGVWTGIQYWYYIREGDFEDLLAKFWYVYGKEDEDDDPTSATVSQTHC